MNERKVLRTVGIFFSLVFWLSVPVFASGISTEPQGEGGFVNILAAAARIVVIVTVIAVCVFYFWIRKRK